WLPQQLGYGGSLALQLGVLALLALVLARLHRPPAQAPAAQAWWQRRWPTHVGGVLIGALATVAYLRVAPLGVTADLGSWARTGAAATG
ncbi:YeeE/YedE thiosulfate transporter family protein, partial [Acinetobacter baumannii]